MTDVQWVPHGPNELAISIPAKEHHHGKDVTVTVYMKAGRGYQVVGCDIEADTDGSVTVVVAAHCRVTGKVVIT